VDSPTLSQVAAHARVCRSTAHRRFGDKDGSTDAVARHEIGLMLAAVSNDMDVDAQPSARSPRRRLRAAPSAQPPGVHLNPRSRGRWLLLAFGDSPPNLVQTVASMVTPEVARAVIAAH
jgi:AcrR family transcriptional regulator